MSIIKLFWRTIILIMCCLIQTFGVIVEGIAAMLYAFADILMKAYDLVLSWNSVEKKEEVDFDIPL